MLSALTTARWRETYPPSTKARAGIELDGQRECLTSTIGPTVYRRASARAPKLPSTASVKGTPPFTPTDNNCACKGPEVKDSRVKTRTATRSPIFVADAPPPARVSCSVGRCIAAYQRSQLNHHRTH